LGAILGIISKQAKQIDEKLLRNCLKASGQWSPHASYTWLENNVAFANREDFLIHDSGCTITADCRIDYREELAIKLELSATDLDKISDARLVLRSYLRWGESCVEHLMGDFAFAIWDKNKQKLFCARDQIGCRPFYYFEDDQHFLFSSNLNGFEPIPGVDYIPQERFILHHFSSKVLPMDSTLYLGIKRLTPAHSMILGPDSSPVLKRYWDLEIDPDYAELSIDEALEQFQDIFKEAVSQRIRNLPAFGVELSGGLDSSSVAVIAQDVKQEGSKVHAFINALPEEQKKDFFPFFDETDYGRKVSDYADLDSFHEINGEKGRGSLESVIEAVKSTHAPVIQLFPVFSDQLLDKVQEQNLELVLSGFGGDECATYHARGILDEYFSKREWAKLRLALGGKTPLRRMAKWVELFLEHRVNKGWVPLKKRIRNRKSKYKLGDLAVGTSFLKPFKEMEKESEDYPLEYRIREQQKRRLNHRSVSDRLENSYFQAQNRNIEYAYPLLDIKLIEFVYSLPAEYKNRYGLGRYLMRKTMEGFLPDDVRQRTSKFGAPIPNIFYRFHMDKDEYVKLIDEAEANNNFHYLDYNKLRWQLDKLMDQKNFLKLSFGPRVFFSSISLLILQKWKREGKMKTGIKC